MFTRRMGRTLRAQKQGSGSPAASMLADRIARSVPLSALIFNGVVTLSTVAPWSAKQRSGTLRVANLPDGSARRILEISTDFPAKDRLTGLGMEFTIKSSRTAKALFNSRR